MASTFGVIPYKDRDEWLGLRMLGIGGSDVSAIMGYNAHKSPLTLWLEKTGRKEPEDLSDNESVKWGVKHEPMLRDEFAANHPELVVQVPGAIYRNAERSWEQASLDGEVYDKAAGEFAVLEIKTAGELMAKDWEDGVPVYYEAQVTHYLNVTGWRRAYVAVLIGGNKYREYIVEPDDADRQAVRDAVAKFWGMVQSDTPPALVGIKDEGEALATYHGDSTGNVRQVSAEADGLIDRYVELGESIKADEHERQQVANKIKQLIGDDKGITTDLYGVTWVRGMRRRLDTKRLAADHPEVVGDYYTEALTDGGLRVRGI